MCTALLGGGGVEFAHCAILQFQSLCTGLMQEAKASLTSTFKKGIHSTLSVGGCVSV